jgi:hypothetical protein
MSLIISIYKKKKKINSFQHFFSKHYIDKQKVTNQVRKQNQTLKKKNIFFLSNTKIIKIKNKRNGSTSKC